ALSVGTYTVTVTDLHGCTTTATAIITQPAAALSVSTTNTAALCGASNGTASSATTGGTTPYTYSWSPSGGTASGASGLAPGTYTLTVMDAHGCSDTSSTTIINSGGATVTTTATPVLCFGGSSGTTTATASGGTTPYTYSWSPSGGTSASASGLTAGTYTVTVTDGSGCPTTSSVTVAQPAALAATAVNTPVTCFGGSTGTATCTATGGTPPYTYSWTTGSTTANTSGLPAGSVTVTVTDAHSCTTTATTSISQPTALTATTTNTPVSCFGGSNGSATALPSGGTMPYTYSWAPSGTSTAAISGLSAGTFTVTVSDAHSCTTTSTATVIQPAVALTVSSTSVSTTCGTNNGTASSTPSGGTAPYVYSWSPSGGTAANSSNLAPGTYTVTVTDAHSCSASTSVIILNSNGINASIASTPIICHNDSTGSVIASVTGGTGPYSYLWNTGQLISTLTNLGAGSYCVFASDASGCKDTACVDLSNPAPVSADFSSDPTITDIYNSEIHFTDLTPGSTTWQWNFGDTTGSISQDPIHTYNQEGTYPVTLIVTNNMGCIDSVTHNIIINDGFTFYAPNAFSPNDNGVNDIFLPKGTGWNPSTFRLLIFDRWGNLIYQTSDMYQGWNGRVKNGPVAQNDVYVWKVDLSDIIKGRKHSYTGSVTIVK
ncbi:MAG: PKD domain-containing protein, partial [Bacteroidia bacterium]